MIVCPRPCASEGEARSIRLEEASYLSLSIQKFSQTISKFSKSKVKFITIRDPKDSKSMDWVRKYLLKFSNCIMIVSSPKGGRHYHALMYEEKPMKFRKKIHFHVQSIGKKSSEIKFDFEDGPPMELHPYIPGLVGSLHLDVMREIRTKNNRPKMSLPSRLKARVLAKCFRQKKSDEINRIISYMLVNYNENPVPNYFSHLYIRN